MNRMTYHEAGHRFVLDASSGTPNRWDCSRCNMSQEVFNLSHKECRSDTNHQWLLTEDICGKCGLGMFDAEFDATKCNSSVQSCCGKKGYAIWDPIGIQWNCSECGAPKSNDPSYLYGHTPKKDSSCVHEWKQYTGLKDTFEYCTKCDVKR